MDENIAILSDLHLGEGVHPVTRRVSRLENFYFDHEFERLLTHLQQRRDETGKPWMLIINGDLIDFLRVTSLPKSPQETSDLAHISPTKRKYGLGTSPAESKWQLEQVIAGHPVVFRSLALFAFAGNRVVIIKGNHDVNWFWPAVRYRFLEKMEGFMREVCSTCGQDENKVAEALDRFEIRQWVYYIEGLLYVEHGNQYDPSNAFKHFLYPLLIDPESPVDLYEIDLPFGSFFLRYFFNKIEYYNPRAANYRYTSSYFHTLWGRHFYEFWNVARNYFPYFFRTLRKFRTREGQNYREIREHHLREIDRIGEEDYGKRDAFREIAGLHQTHAYETGFDFLVSILKRPIKKMAGALVAVLLLSLLGNLFSQAILSSHLNLFLRTTLGLFIEYGFIILAIVAALMFLRPTPGGTTFREAEPETLRQKAAQIARILRVPYITFGHSHVADMWKVPGVDTWYFNTGTWMPFIDLENQIVRPEVQFPVITIENGTARFLRWNPRDNALEDQVLLEERTED